MSHLQTERPAQTASLPVSAPHRVRDLLRAAPDGPAAVVHRGPQAVYFEVAGRCVGLLAAEAVQVPCGLRSRRRPFARDEGASAHVEAGVLHVDGTALAVGRVVSVDVPRLGDLGRLAPEAVFPTVLPTPVLAFLLAAAPTGIGPDAVGRLVGRGDGLTPLGDDVLCGWLATQRACALPTPDVDAAVRASLGRTTLLSATLLDCALEGGVLPELGRWLSAVGSPDQARRTTDLLAVGGSSGAGLLAGALLALDLLGSVTGSAA